MASWYSNLLTRTSSQISSLRATLLSSEADGDSDDDTHLCRVLRNYYADRGRPLPPWLPPDPKAAAAAPQPLYAQPAPGARYGLAGPQPTPPPPPPHQQQQQPAGALSSLWDPGPAKPSPNLRGIARPTPGQRSWTFQNPGVAGQRTPVVTAPGPVAGAGPVSSAQDRLRQRLWGAASSSSTTTTAAPAPTPPPPNTRAPASYMGTPAASWSSAARDVGNPQDRPPAALRHYTGR